MHLKRPNIGAVLLTLAGWQSTAPRLARTKSALEMKIQFLLYVIILGLVLNLLADMIWKYIPRTNQYIDKIVTGVLISICVLLLIFYKEEHKNPESSQQIKYIGRIIDSKTNAIL